MTRKGNVQRGKDALAKPPAAMKPAAPAAGGVVNVDNGGRTLRHADDAVATILARDAYVRERHYLLMRMITVLAIALVVSLALNVFVVMQPVKMRFFATDSDGKIKELVALDRPITTMAELNNWVTNSIAQAYTFSFANYRQELTAARANFTAAGWKGFEKALNDSGNLKAVIDNKYVTTAVPTGAPILLTQGLIEGRYAWKFQLPILVTYQSATQRTTQSLMVTAIVVRQPETEHPRGLGIASLIAE